MKKTKRHMEMLSVESDNFIEALKDHSADTQHKSFEVIDICPICKVWREQHDQKSR